jgi:pSer/pThr/pTyr-binding forkhead associated (FHA) protein
MYPERHPPEAGQPTAEPPQPAAAAHSRLGQATLVVIEGESPGRRLPMGDAPLIIGRGMGVDLQLKDPTVSRHHCVIWRAAGRCWVRDLGSTNQTRVNQRPAFTTEIFEGDVVRVGHTALVLTMKPAGQPARDAAETDASP